MDFLYTVFDDLYIYPHIVGFPDHNLYDCSNRSLEEWYSRGSQHLFQGYFSLIFGSVAVATYIITLFAIVDRPFLRNPCHQVMLITSFYDIVNIFVSNVVSGYYFILGANFCTHPVTNPIFGAIGVASWGGMCVAVMSLALSRLANVTGKGGWLFDERATKIWFILSLITTFFLLFFTYPAVFDSKMGYWFFVPYIRDNTQEEFKIFKNVIFLYVYIGGSVVNLIAYVSLICYVIYLKTKSVGPIFTSLERNLFLQCSLISILLSAACFFYATTFLFQVPPIFKTMTQFFYQTSECAPLLGYLIFNNSIRKKVLTMIAVSTSTNTKRSNNNSILFTKT